MVCPVVIEVRPRVQACNVALTSPLQGASLQLSVQPEKLVLQWSVEGLTVLEQSVGIPQDVDIKFQPQSLSGLSLQDSTVSFRLQTEPAVGLTGSFSTQIIVVENPTFMKSDKQPDITCGSSYHILCGCCRKSLLTSDCISFERVLPLPSSQCDVGDFFCHKHTHENSSSDSDAVESNIAPKQVDCFYSSCFIKLHRSLFDTVESVMRCKRCLSWLGTSDKDSVCLWNCTAIVQEVGKNLEQQSASHPAHDFVALVQEIIRDCVPLTCRILFEAKLSSNCVQYLLLSVMDRELLLLTLNSPSESQLVKHKTVKVSFFFEKVNSHNVSLWQNDSRVNIVEVAFPILVHGLKLLTTTSQLIPAASRQAQDGFLLAYICADFIS